VDPVGVDPTHGIIEGIVAAPSPQSWRLVVERHGFVRSGHGSDDVEPLVSKDRNTTKLVTLGEMAKRHKINLDQDTLVMKKQARYCTHL
jgi:hypothetical protein